MSHPVYRETYFQHAAEANMAIPKVPVLFVKPATAVADPYPGKIIIPKVAQDGSSDYEGELTVVIGKTGKDIKEEDAYDYILGYTSGNDVSARNAQFASSQWCYSKGDFPPYL
jgi:2-keto-4-pentenoate hydratase/2-oxohepta-3-ene-1,7-dioic acid hydratase in catechol pathway